MVSARRVWEQGWEVAQRSLGDQGCLSLSQDSLQAQHLVVGSGESPPEYKEIPPQSQTQRQVKGYLPTSSSWFTGETTTPGGVGTRRGHWPDGDGTGPRQPLRWRGAHLHSPGRGCFHPGGSKRSYSTPGLSANGPEGAGPWRPVGRQVRPPPAALPLAWPSPGRLHRLGARSSPAPSLLGDRWVEPPSRQRKQSED
ncbi:hypothetical protein J1605_012766 [Eschrichtius robustus]|uniref:Uncharacterized protein n=1 Tax=Eschrichtius robustus TaxID=9764 RepID=A0AB34GIP1_ESCRO|nr:hypothetical protein J1605_012766 [Eschrichtius robustus]